ncbi:MAG: anthranilate synthase component I [Rhodospirillaceae bacterium]|nr:anthranilate synthase component I [Rhodospirillaceae bacterium]MBL6930432.1 anthranilate synthase component I [Rhodospirillales bacterium]MBL6942646.1 anthranilate synthase component I [Rhodospirillales bacterium]
MDLFPDASAFTKAYQAGTAQVVWTTLVSDLDTPVSAFLKLAKGQANSFLLESVEGGAIRGRYSFIGLKPDLIWRCVGDKAEINRQAATNSDAFEACDEPSIPSLKALVEESCIDLPYGLPPMAAGLVGYMAYDSVRLVENLPDINPDVLGVPDGIFVRPTIMAVFDTIEDTVTLITPARPVEGIRAEAAFDDAVNRLAEAVSLMESSLPQQSDLQELETPEPVSNMTHRRFHEIVEKAKQYILAGDIFQVVLSQRFAVPFKLPPFSLYRALRRLNPSPFLFHLNFGDFSIVGSSPEILVRVREGKVTIRPIAGTRPRGQTPEEDEALAAELLADPKELAEHLMLLDLGRNDVGRVAKVGTVKVTEQMKIERYSHVMHIVSNVEGELAPDYDAIGALFAGFPAGTVSGAPKVRAMEIIDELETEKRGIYAGCIGYFGANGDMDTCIALRTAVVKDDTMYVQAGGGIVADSDPEAEYQESRNKARALIRAAEEAVRFASARN